MIGQEYDMEKVLCWKLVCARQDVAWTAGECWAGTCVKRVWRLFLFSQMQAELIFIRTILLTSRWCLCSHGWKVILCSVSEWWVAFQISKIRTIKLCASLRDNLLLFSLTSCRSSGKLLAESPNLIYFRIEFFVFIAITCLVAHVYWGSCLLFPTGVVWGQTRNAH